MRRTKLICTLGPASSREDVLRDMLLAGMNVARLNFSHGTHESHGQTIDLFRRVRDSLGLPAAVMLDTRGPEIRLGSFDQPVRLDAGQEYCFTTRDIPGDARRCSVTYQALPTQLKPGDGILVDDGKVSFLVARVTQDEIHCVCPDGGTLSSRKGVNVPGVALSLPFLSDSDRADLLFGIQQDVDYVAASFTRCRQDVELLRIFLNENGGKRIRIIAKIESTQGVENFGEILEAADGIMIARGDMGVEIPYELLPGLQKQFIASCLHAGKIAITATQMLESMIVNRRPTRAEITDVANAVFDGTSAVMLSGETASGAYPVEATKVMARIAKQAEADAFATGAYENTHRHRDTSDITNAISAAACITADELNASAIIADTTTGTAARRVSKHRPEQTILAATPQVKTFHQLALSWGVTPILTKSASDVEELLHNAISAAKADGLVKTGDTVVMTAGSPLNTQGSTNMLKVETVL